MKKMFIVLLLLGTISGGYYWLKHEKKTLQSSADDNVSATDNKLAIKDIELLDAKPKTDAIHLYQKGMFAKAVAHLRKDLQQKENQDRNLAYLAKCYQYLGNYNACKKSWQMLIKQFPQSSYVGDAKYYLSVQAQKEHLASSAQKLMREASDYFQVSVGGQKAVLELANYYYQKKDSNSALEAWRFFSMAIRSHLPLPTKLSIKKILDPLVKKMCLQIHPQALGAIHYRVQGGDNLGRIARKYDTSVGLILWLNQKANTFLRIGEELRIIPGAAWIHVSKRDFFLVVFLNNKKFPHGLYLKSYRVGLGKNNKTPVGQFMIKTKIKEPPWYNEGKRIAYGDPRNVLGTRWMGFENRPGMMGFGIHGTKDPNSIGKNMSNGCVRMRNEEVEELFELIPRETKVIIQ